MAFNPRDQNVLDQLAKRIADRVRSDTPPPAPGPAPVTNVNVDVDRLAKAIVDGMAKFAPVSQVEGMVDEVFIGRYSITRSDEYTNILKLPSTVAAWRIQNEGLVAIRLAMKKTPSDAGNDSYIVIKGSASDAPPIYPALMKREVDIFLRLESGSAAQDVVIVYTTSRNPIAVAAVASATASSSAAVSNPPTTVSGNIVIAKISGETVTAILSADIQIGAVEIKDGAAAQRLTITSGGDGINYAETDVSGSIIIAKISGETVSIAGGVTVSGNVVNVSGATVIAKISGETVSIAGGINVSGSVVQISGQFVSISGGVTTSVSGNTVYLAHDTRSSLLFSGVVNWASGNASGNPISVLIAPPGTIGDGDSVVIALRHGALSADVTLVVEKALTVGTAVMHPELTRMTQNRGTSGVAAAVRGIFAGATSGRLTAVHSNTLVENVTGDIVVYRL